MNIAAKKDYILVTPSKGLSFWEVLTGLAKLVSMPEFQEKNDIWVFNKGHLDILYSDLYKIRDFAEKIYPKNAGSKKTAIVAETGMQRSLAEMYARIEDELPHEIRVFPDLNSAEKWIAE